jgi:hypothetical protein
MTNATVKNWQALADEATLERTVEALQANHINVFVADNREQAKQHVLELIPDGAEVFTATSATVQAVGIADEINESGRYDAIRKKFMSMDRATHGAEMRKMGAGPDYVIGSVHAVTENGDVLTASFGGSQLSSYAHGAGKVIWVVSTNKIVKDLDEGFRRIAEHSLPLESERLHKIFGRHSEIGKILIVRKEPVPGRITLVFVKEALGF